jgi:hypothetical protein
VDARLVPVRDGILLFVGLTWLQVLKDPPLYMAALAFSAYGIHWFLSVLGMVVLFGVSGGWPVGLLFAGLTWVYVSEFFTSLPVPAAERMLGLAHTVTGLWLMYLVFSTVMDIASGYNLPSA